MTVRIARGNEVVDRALQVIANAVTVEQLGQTQAVVLPLRYGLSLAQTAQVTDLSMGWVSKQRNRFILMRHALRKCPRIVGVAFLHKNADNDTQLDALHVTR
jgi:hypothetical protein